MLFVLWFCVLFDFWGGFVCVCVCVCACVRACIKAGMNLRKVNRHVDFPLILDLAPFCSASCKVSH